MAAGAEDRGVARGVAFDIGTTTLVGCLVDLDTGEVLATSSRPNPGKRWGADVTSRIKAVMDDPAATVEMRRCTIAACNDIIDDLADGSAAISTATAAGNTVMEHILAGVSPEGLGRVPYKPAFKDALVVSAADSGLKIAEDGELYIFPIAGGFVGGDTVAAILSTGLEGDSSNDTPALLIDIGTNSEIVLSAGGTLYAAATPAGPAFEGGEVSSGMTAAAGAIEGINIDGDRVMLKTIGGGSPKGICGSGLIEAVSVFNLAGLIDTTGRIVNPDEVDTNLAGKIITSDDGNSVLLHRDASGEVRLTQADVRALQVAKASVAGAIKVLLKKAEVDAGDIGKVFLAGAFGQNLSAEALASIGVLDKGWLDAVEVKGDAALDGARMALAAENKDAAALIASSTKYVSLSGSKHFEKEFIASIDIKAGI